VLPNVTDAKRGAAVGALGDNIEGTAMPEREARQHSLRDCAARLRRIAKENVTAVSGQLLRMAEDLELMALRLDDEARERRRGRREG
jgi:hypothetical protein